MFAVKTNLLGHSNSLYPQPHKIMGPFKGGEGQTARQRLIGQSVHHIQVLQVRVLPRKFPDFIRPSINPSAECNIWGPLCQTGSIAVDVNLTTTSTPTIVACLSAQSFSAIGNGFRPNQYSDYMQSFGRSPDCASYAVHQTAEYDYLREHGE